MGEARAERILAAACPAEIDSPAGEVSALFARLRDPVYWHVFGLVGDAAEAEDLTQEAFLRLFRDLNQGQKIGNPQAWVFRVAHNLALGRLRHLAIERTHASEEQRVADARPDPEQSVLANEQQRGISLGWRRLSGQERQCLLLRSEGLRYREIAEILDLRISTVATFLGRAIGKLTEGIRGG